MKPVVMVAADRDPFMVAEMLSEFRLHNPGCSVGIKVNLDYILKVGIREAARVGTQFDLDLFGDIKIWNGSRTMLSILDQMEDAGFTYANVHILAGPEIRPRQGPLKLLGVALLTHYDKDYGSQFYGLRTAEQVAKLIGIANSMSDLHGIICHPASGHLISDEKLKVFPGIRPAWFSDNRHSKPWTPTMAKMQHADILVIGSPVTKSPEPLQALERIFEEIQD